MSKSDNGIVMRFVVGVLEAIWYGLTPLVMFGMTAFIVRHKTSVEQSNAMLSACVMLILFLYVDVGRLKK